MGRTPCCEKMGLKRGPWTKQEDDILVSYINQFGHHNWRALPKLAGLLRCGKSCRLRWTNYLRLDIKRGNFTLEEEDTIIHLHHLLGNRWSKIAAKLPGRTDNEIKNVWHTHLKKRLLIKKPVDDDDQYHNNNTNVTSSSSDDIPSNQVNYSPALQSSSSSDVAVDGFNPTLAYDDHVFENYLKLDLDGDFWSIENYTAAASNGGGFDNNGFNTSHTLDDDDDDMKFWSDLFNFYGGGNSNTGAAT